MVFKMENIKIIRPNCMDCVHGCGGYSGDGWNEPMEFEFECDFESTDDDRVCEVEKILSSDACEEDCSTCPEFEPRMAEKCARCGKPINSPGYSWPFVENFYEPVYACSQGCLDKIEENTRKEFCGAIIVKGRI